MSNNAIGTTTFKTFFMAVMFSKEPPYTMVYPLPVAVAATFAAVPAQMVCTSLPLMLKPIMIPPLVFSRCIWFTPSISVYRLFYHRQGYICVLCCRYHQVLYICHVLTASPASRTAISKRFSPSHPSGYTPACKGRIYNAVDVATFSPYSLPSRL